MDIKSSGTLMERLQRQIKYWPRKQYFHQWFFNEVELRNKKKKINRLIDDTDWWLEFSCPKNLKHLKINFRSEHNESFIKGKYEGKLEERKRISLLINELNNR